MFGFIILPITFLGGTYCSWTKLAPVTVGGWHWLQAVVLINPLICNDLRSRHGRLVSSASLTCRNTL
jgi:ABC-2 type transport system permease protein